MTGRERLSSRLTFVYKVVLPVVWLGTFAVVTATMSLVPLAGVARVSGSRFVDPPVVRLHLRRPCEFGDRIVFMPRTRLSFGFTEHPAVREVRQIVGRGRG